MTMTHPAAGRSKWRFPTWKEEPDAFRVAFVGYDAWADELVIRLANAEGKIGIVEPLVTPENSYANVMADADTGEVIGVQIDNLRAAALRHFPHWASVATEDEPPPAAVDRLVADVHDLFMRYGVGGYVWQDGELRWDSQMPHPEYPQVLPRAGADATG